MQPNNGGSGVSRLGTSGRRSYHHQLQPQQQQQQQQRWQQQSQHSGLSSGGYGSSSSAAPGATNGVGTSPAGGAVTGRLADQQGQVSGVGAVAPSRRILPARVSFCPGRRSVYGAVNCQPPEPERQSKETEEASQEQQRGSSQVTAAAADASPSTRIKKPGPVLLELRLLRPESNPRLRKDGKCLSSTTVAISRGNPSLGGGVASTCLSFKPDNANAQAAVTSAAASVSAPVLCATGLTSGALCLHTFTDLDDCLAREGDSGGSNQQQQPVFSSVAYYAPRHHRAATSVAWRPGPTLSELRHVAVGLTGSGGGDRGGTTHAGGAYQRGRPSGSGLGDAAAAMGGTGMAGSAGYHGGSGTIGGGGGGGAGDREFCCLVWDIEAQRQGVTIKGGSGQVPVRVPVFRFAHNTAVSSLSWLSSGNLLAVGTQNRGAVQLYDLRVSGRNAPPVSIYAHSDAVAGIEGDPFRSHVFATFGRGAKEPVKLWDARRMDGAIGEIKMGESDMVSCVAWSTHPGRSGTLTVAIGDTLKMYDTAVSGSRPALVSTRHFSSSVQSVAFQPGATVNDAMSAEDKLSADFYPHRMLTILDDAKICDAATYPIAPLDVSRRDGRVGFCLGRAAWIGADGDVVPSTMDKSTVPPLKEDVSQTTMRRARAFHSARFSVDAGTILDLLEDETKKASTSISTNDSTAKDHSTKADLIHLWRWIDRVEFLCSEKQDATGADELPPWPSKGLIDAGVHTLLRLDAQGSIGGDIVSQSQTLGCDVYDSPLRRAALNACGLLGKFDLRDVLVEIEANGNFERSATLAVWHGDIGAAVAALQRGADRIRLKMTEEKESGMPLTEKALSMAQYAETLQLVGMCISGYRPGTESDAGNVWRQSCEALLVERTADVPYLQAMCVFLLNIGKADGLDKILHEESLSLSDRVAFACLFLDRTALKEYLDACIDTCRENANLECIVITGLEKRGIRLLQCYLDATSDVQTAALVSSRVLLPVDWVAERAMCSEWLDCYRDLLNTFSMWQSRAMFDVGRAELLRTLKDRQTDDLQAMAAAPIGRMASQGRRGYPNALQGRPRQSSTGTVSKQSESGTEIVANYPPQLYARCNYCNTSLPLSKLRRQEGIASGWLSRQKPVLSCCPSCRKPLPRCALCLLPLGCLNPYMELKRERNRISRTGQTTQGAMDDLSDLSNIPFAEWFTWCIACKHGGHAHHLVGWFAKHETCPVSGCDCQCQFDGLRNLPAGK